MIIALLAGINVIHTTRWANSFCHRGHEVHLITSHEGGDPLDPNVITHNLPYKAPFGYYLNVNKLKKLLDSINPDVLNAHYASGYGTLARLSRFHPYVLSVWGSDVYDFPDKSFLHKLTLRKNLLAADVVCSTSHVMANQTKKICPEIKHIPVTPFGIDTNLFKPAPKDEKTRQITIGTVKTLKAKYGIDVLLKAFAFAKKELSKKDSKTSHDLRLIIVGGGPQENELKELAKTLNIESQCIWAGKVNHNEVPRFLNQIDIYVALSRLDSESFGVAILEASACGKPVIVSNVGGLPEVVKDGETGIIVNKESPEDAGKAILELVNNQVLREQMGKQGILHVQENYEWEKCVDILENIYQRYDKRSQLIS